MELSIIGHGVICLALLVSSSPALASQYSITYLPELTSVKGIDDSGRIVGTSLSNFHGVLDINGTLSLPPLPSGYELGWGLSGVTPSGTLYGGVYIPGGAVDHPNSAAFFYQGGQFTYFQGASSSDLKIITDVTNQGEAVGWYVRPGLYAAFVYSQGQFTTLLGPKNEFAFAESANDQEVVGYYNSTPGDKGFIYQNGRFETFVVPGSTSTQITAISKDGTIVGNYTTSLGGPNHGFSDKDGIINTFDANCGALTYTTALYINDSGLIVGEGFPGFGGGSPCAFVYKDNTLNYLPLDPGQPYQLLSITGVNDNGDIVGNLGTEQLGDQEVFLAAPSTPVPEPKTSVFLGCGILVFTVGGRNRFFRHRRS
ncbi:MAG: hypothetical protein JO061_17575 [Acidobacteriaceae bacterium]|nr:hypothetical protein [Acidobacteriaceae bacterium]